MVLMDDLQSNPVHNPTFNINIESRVLLKRDGGGVVETRKKRLNIAKRICHKYS